MLAAREQRAAVQKELLATDTQASLLTVTMNIPGPVKNSAALTQLFLEVIETIEETVEDVVPIANLYSNEPTGPEYYLLLSLSCKELKKRMVAIETSHPWGRFFDLDVLYLEQQEVKPYSRKELGYAPRKCFICEQDAKICGRSRNHSITELQNKIIAILSERSE